LTGGGLDQRSTERRWDQKRHPAAQLADVDVRDVNDE
jgi:hypothetical protein